MLKISAVPCFDDNYIWVLHDNRAAIAVDPGEATPLHHFLAQHELQLDAVFLTHRHRDHVGGIAELATQTALTIYGPADISGVTHPLIDGQTVKRLGTDFKVLAVPGHTREHLAYLVNGALFCGDTLFSCGCGRVFDDTWQEMHDSLQKIASLPDDTLLYPAHEYTASNLRFALAVEPNNPALITRQAEVSALRSQHRPSLPVTLATEKACNPFLRLAQDTVITASQHEESTNGSSLEVFCTLRRWKDRFR